LERAVKASRGTGVLFWSCGGGGLLILDGEEGHGEIYRGRRVFWWGMHKQPFRGLQNRSKEKIPEEGYNAKNTGTGYIRIYRDHFRKERLFLIGRGLLRREKKSHGRTGRRKEQKKKGRFLGQQLVHDKAYILANMEESWEEGRVIHKRNPPPLTSIHWRERRTLGSEMLGQGKEGKDSNNLEKVAHD